VRYRAILFGTLASAVALSAENPGYSLVAYYYTGVEAIDPRSLRLSSKDLELEQVESLVGFDADLNGDGTADHILRGGCSATGSCSLRLVDGKSNKLIGSLSGRPLIVHSERINGWPVLSIYHHTSSTDGTFTTYVHDGKRYQQVSSIMLYEQSVQELFKKLETVKTIGR
jgi:hypothetical protein